MGAYAVPACVPLAVMASKAPMWMSACARVYMRPESERAASSEQRAVSERTSGSSSAAAQQRAASSEQGWRGRRGRRGHRETGGLQGGRRELQAPSPTLAWAAERARPAAVPRRGARVAEATAGGRTGMLKTESLVPAYSVSSWSLRPGFWSAVGLRRYERPPKPSASEASSSTASGADRPAPRGRMSEGMARRPAAKEESKEPLSLLPPLRRAATAPPSQLMHSGLDRFPLRAKTCALVTTAQASKAPKARPAVGHFVLRPDHT